MDKNPLLSSKEDGAGSAAGVSGGNSVPHIGMGERGSWAPPARRNQAVVATGHILSDRNIRRVLRLLKASALMGLASLVVMTTFLFQGKLESVEARKALWTANAVLGSLCVVILLPCVAWYVLSLVEVKARGYSLGHREKWDAGLNMVLFFSTLVNCIFYLVPNATALTDEDGRVKAIYVAWTFFIRLTMWNNIYFIFMARSRLLNPWIDSKSEHVREREDSLLVDAPFWKHWYLPIPWLVYQGILVMLIISWINEAKDPGDEDQKYIVVDEELPGENVLCDDTKFEGPGVIAISIALAVYQLIGVIFCYRGYTKLTKVSYNLYREPNIALRYHLQHIQLICFIEAMSFVFMYFVKRESCVKQVLLFFGLLPAQFLMTMQSAINCIVAAPAVKDYREEEVDPNRLTWIERPVSEYETTLDRIEHTPQFCFETALRTCLWSQVAYKNAEEKKDIIDPETGLLQEMVWGMKMYGLTNHVSIKEDDYDSYVEIAWSNETVVVSFRGTASSKNALTDVKAWMESYPSGSCLWLPGIQSAVHAGFAHIWKKLNSKEKVVDKVIGILGSKEFEESKAKIIVTGHSLGGAMAILAAYDIAAKLEEDGFKAQKHVMCYTFGAPRVGNATFAAKFDAQVPNTWQVINDIDVIPTLPKFGFLYRHVGHKAIINESGDLIVNPTVAEFSMRMLWSFFESILQVDKHYLKDYKESFRAILKGRGRGLRGGDEAIPEILKKNNKLVCEVFEVSSGDPTSS